MLKREGIHVNKKRVHRLYCLEGLQLRPKRPRRNVSRAHRKRDYIRSTRPNEAWAMDFVADQRSTGNKFRILTVVDTFTRECLAADIGVRLRSENVVAMIIKNGVEDKLTAFFKTTYSAITLGSQLVVVRK